MNTMNGGQLTNRHTFIPRIQADTLELLHSRSLFQTHNLFLALADEKRLRVRSRVEPNQSELAPPFTPCAEAAGGARYNSCRFCGRGTLLPRPKPVPAATWRRVFAPRGVSRRSRAV
jgi:hypothetical protein